MKIMSLVLSMVLMAASFQADAKRMGSGRSIGKQSGQVTQRESAKPAATPGQNAATPPAVQQPRRPWGAMLGGLLALGLMMLVGWFMRRRAVGNSASPYAYAGAGSAANPGQVAQYNPAKVGNDASARPWENPSTTYPSGQTPSRASARIGSALIGGGQNWTIPEGFDVQGFVQAAKQNFISLQAAWDLADIPALRAMMTDGMLTEIQSQLAERGELVAGPNTTEVVMLEAQLLGIEDLGDVYMASIEFSGLIREESTAGPSPFREVWNMTKPKNGSLGWLVAGVQALQ